ncbi:MAG: Flp/Fap pilin component [Syntrophus sp. PtaB.Bin138]|nr:MAG: Flp/Fap pilin component [Syntrophus sp. PtaB.Bin138]
MEKMIRFFKDEEGASMVEYGLLVALIAAVVMLAIGPLGNAISTMFGTVTTQVGS